MELTIFWTLFAENKLFDIYAYYSKEAGVRTARKLVTSIVDVTKNLINNPEMGVIEMLLEDRPQNFRFLVFKNYKIIYWINYQSNRIEIVNVFDCRQNPVKISET
ncbi:type II toxin-antitoxin system RelE/ParE family toxin [Algoriphagus sp. D3-2-R+10]|uniref:type II toxin-antitoxin system RelE/ParE family toxin n=1 Tax=Algoriphagus aurantiacus TaxID=3103948 RepID=UPI002B3EF748|nr:type II toxin-antitoxin system RelE/ParE family toxin [Algoriphagus sp. D3-2-R+10]MEB2776557.1 type II toxin-antitoxin system RelE/ParE family toxin [Algoriphagus sp. D3-2-R+10]